jgi:hypothetical protein
MNNCFTINQKIILLTNTLVINEKIYKYIYGDDYVHMMNVVIDLLYFNIMLNKEMKEGKE